MIAGAYGKSFQEAEVFKRDESHHKELAPVIKPVVDKVSSIISNHIKGHQVDEISLVGGTCCFTGIEDMIEKKTGVYTHKPHNPMFVTPLGIALSCFNTIAALVPYLFPRLIIAAYRLTHREDFQTDGGSDK